MTAILVKVLIGQVIVGIIVVAILKARLDQQLIESAVRRLEFWEVVDSGGGSVDEVVVILSKNLTSLYKNRILMAVKKNFSESTKTVFTNRNKSK